MMSPHDGLFRRVTAGALALLLLAPSLALAAASEVHTVYLVPATDSVLASMVLTAKGQRDPVLLVDLEDQSNVRQVASLWKGERVCLARSATPRAMATLMESIAGRPCTVVGDLADLAHQLWPEPKRVVLFPESDYGAMLRAAAFASLLDAALFPVADAARFQIAALAPWRPESVAVSGSGWSSAASDRALPNIDDAGARENWRGAEDPHAVVVANPNDRNGIFSPSSLSLVAPLLSALHAAPLLLVSDPSPEVIEREVTAAIDRHRWPVSHIILVGDELGLRSHRIPDPVLEAGGPVARGGGKVVRVELFSEIQNDRPQDFVVGRVVADNAVIASLNLARRLHGPPLRKGRPAIFLANADQVFALGETISRATVQDLQNVGVPVRAFYREDVTPEVSQQSLAQTDVLVWEGHPRDLTLEERGGIAVDVAPQIVVLQGCYTLDRSDPFILIEKGTQAIVATSAAIYSASGSSLARAFLDRAVNDGTDIGTALRDARNYLLAVAHLKRERGHQDWRKTWRAALAFSLWGDPFMKLPLRPGKPTQSQSQWRFVDAAGDPTPPATRRSAPAPLAAPALELTIPKARLRPISVGKYRASPPPRAMLSSILWREEGDEHRSAIELFYTSAKIAAPAAVCAPNGDWGVTSLYAPRSKLLFVLALPERSAAESKPERRTVRFAIRDDCASP